MIMLCRHVSLRGPRKGLETACQKKGAESVVKALAPDEQGAEDLAEAATAPANECEVGQTEAFVDSGGESVNNGGEEAAAWAAPAAPSVMASREVAVLADVDHAASVDTACAAEGAERLAEASPSVAKGAEAVTKAKVASVDEFAAGWAEAVQQHAADPVASVVVTTLEVAVPADASQAADVGSHYVGEDMGHLAGARASKEQLLEAVTKAMVAPADEFTAGQAEAVQGGEEDGGENGGEDRGNNDGKAAAAAPVAPTASAVIETPDVAVPADGGHVVDTTCAAEDAERLAGISTSQEKVAQAVATAMVAPIDEFAAGQDGAVQDGENGEENSANNSGEAAAAASAAQTVMETREVAVLADVGHAASVDTACIAGVEERLARASPSEARKDREAVAKTMVVPLDEFVAGQAEAVQDGGEEAATAPSASVAPVVVETLEVAVSADVGRTASVDTPRGAEGTERKESGPPKKMGMAL